MTSPTSPIIILTGASRGLGLATLRILLTQHNAKVSTLSRSLTSELSNVSKEFGSDRVLVIQGDVGKEEDNASVVSQTVQKWGGIDGLILNAGSLQPGKLSTIPTSSLIQYIQTNLLSTIYLIQPALPYLRQSKQKGRIVLVSSGAATTGYQAWGLYSMAKAGMNSLARTLAAEERANGVAVWAVRPGVINTDMQALIRSDGPEHMDPTEMSKFSALHEKKQLLAPEIPGSVLAGLAVDGPIELSGEFITWEDDRLSQFQLRE